MKCSSRSCGNEATTFNEVEKKHYCDKCMLFYVLYAQLSTIEETYKTIVEIIQKIKEELNIEQL